jgi:hypothetical protein
MLTITSQIAVFTYTWSPSWIIPPNVATHCKSSYFATITISLGLHPFFLTWIISLQSIKKKVGHNMMLNLSKISCIPNISRCSLCKEGEHVQCNLTICALPENTLPELHPQPRRAGAAGLIPPRVAAGMSSTLSTFTSSTYLRARTLMNQ